MNRIILIINTFIFLTVICRAQDTTSFRPDIANKDYLKCMNSLEDYLFVKETKHRVKNSTIASVGNDSIVSQINLLNKLFDITYNVEIEKYVDLYTKSNRHQTELMLGMHNAYLPLVEKELAKLRLPQELKYLPMAISACNPSSVSGDGTVGLWQIYYTTGKIYNLKINTFVDERRSPEKSTKVAVRYLKDMYKIYYDWGLAIAAYNCGPANVNKAIARSGGKKNIWDIYGNLPHNKREVIPAFVAVLYFANNYKIHNINPASIKLHAVFDTVNVNEKVHLGQIAGVLNLNTKQLNELNEVYRKMIIHPAGEYTILKLPVGYKKNFIKYQDSIYNYMDTVFFKPIPDIVLAPEKATPTATGKGNYTPPNIEGKTKLVYTVKSGDNLGFIASWYGVKVADLKYWNNIYRNRIVVGDKLSIYHDKPNATKYSQINTMSFEQKQAFVGKNAKKESSESSSAVKLDPNFVYYKVRSGDNPWIIAKQFPGISAENIEEINGWDKNYKLYPGQYIKIKRK